MKLELKQASPYLPYSPTIYFESDQTMTLGMEDDRNVVGINSLIGGHFTNNPKLALRPLSDLTKEELEKQGFWHHVDWLTHELQSEVKRTGVKGLNKHINNSPFEMVQY